MMAADIRLDRATPLDAPLLAALHARCFARSWNAEEMAQFIASPDALCLIATPGNATESPGGFLIARKAADEAELLTLGVDPRCRRMGLGKALLAAVIQALRAGGARRLFLEVEIGNDAALALYSAFGAAEVGRRAAYYEHGADAAIFSLALSCDAEDDGGALARRQA
jgi:[ribosomal protein S18]-alanine N-acetyltransferase